MITDYHQAKSDLRAHASPAKAAILQRFFKTGKGEYAEGDQFLGVVVPDTRKVARMHKHLPMVDLAVLLQSPIHEERLCALLIMVHQFERGNDAGRRRLFDFYLRHTGSINNWDLVDTSAPKIVGAWLRERDRAILYTLVKSQNLWERRIAILSTFEFIRHGDFSDALKISQLLLPDRHDLIHKAVGWMLREIGKRDEPTLRDFLQRHYRNMPRTMLRYAIEEYPAATRRRYLEGRI